MTRDGTRTPDGNTDDILVLDENFLTNRAAFYRQVREGRAVRRARASDGLMVWLITGYDEARSALTDPRLSKNTGRTGESLARQGVRGPAFSGSLNENMLNSDPPDHTRLRALVGRAFTKRAVERLRPRIEELTTELADAMSLAGPTVDLLDEFAFPLPMTVICEILGVPQERREAFRRWTEILLSSQDTEERGRAMTATSEFLGALVADKAAHPEDDMLSTIASVARDGDALSADETTSMAFLLLVAGHETTVNLILNGTRALLENPDQAARLRAEPELIPGAVEEFLRYDSPVDLATLRVTTEAVTIADTTIPAGDLVLVSLLDANHDPAHFAEPDELDVPRRTVGHLGFGHGIHHCVGAPLARLEGEIAFRTLLDRFPDLAPDGEPGPYRPNTALNGVTWFPVRLRP